MTHKELQALPVGTELTVRTGNKSHVCYLACASRDAKGRVLISTRPVKGMRWREKPAALSLPAGKQ